jgi:hypothetical protein
MPLNLPNLDDRTYKDLTQEALALIPAHAPEWTNHNPSDPGVTLVELLAYLSEMLIYRVNRVTDANTIAFLKLIKGPQWSPSSTASLTEEIRDAVQELRHVNRAVTGADFERLACEADLEVARARCIPRRNLESENSLASAVDKPGHVSVVIIPRGEALNPMPSDSLVKKVSEYLDMRRLLTTKVHVVGPRYFSFGLQLTLVLKADVYEADVRAAAIDALKKFFDPVKGGEAGTGWLFGRNAYLSEVYQLLDTLSGVDYVTQTDVLDEFIVDDPSRLLRNAAGGLVGVELNPDELINITQMVFNLTIQQAKRQP